jgi:hypothetical protein
MNGKVIILSWPKAKEIILAYGAYEHILDPLNFEWEKIGLKNIKTSLTYGWHFEVVDLKKLTFFMLKCNFSL